MILSSGYSPKEFQAKMDQLGIRVFVPKPYNTHELLRSVRDMLDAAPASA